MHRYTIDFINYFSKYIIELPILVILAGNDFNRLRQIENSVLIHVPLLTEEESISYMNRLLEANFLKIWPPVYTGVRLVIRTLSALFW